MEPRPLRDMLGTNRRPGVQQAMHAARSQTEEQRKLILAYPDLAEKLTKPPMKFEHPWQWNGFIPPAEVMGSGGRFIANDAPVRKALLDLLAIAAERADDQGGDRVTAFRDLGGGPS